MEIVVMERRRIGYGNRRSRSSYSSSRQRVRTVCYIRVPARFPESGPTCLLALPVLWHMRHAHVVRRQATMVVGRVRLEVLGNRAIMEKSDEVDTRCITKVIACLFSFKHKCDEVVTRRITKGLACPFHTSALGRHAPEEVHSFRYQTLELAY